VDAVTNFVLIEESLAMTDEEFNVDVLRRLRRSVQGQYGRVCIINNGCLGRIGSTRYRIAPVNTRGSFERLS